MITYLDGGAPVEMDVSDQEAAEILAYRGETARPSDRLHEVRRKHPQAYARWTPEDEARLRELFAGGMSPEAIAARMGRQVGGVCSRLRKLGLIAQRLTVAHRLRARSTTSAMCGVPGGGSMRGSTACTSTVNSGSSSGARSSAPT